MNVIKHGKFYNHECTCELCGCVFEYNKEDIENYYDGVGRVIMPCPECKTPCMISNTSVGTKMIKNSF